MICIEKNVRVKKNAPDQNHNILWTYIKNLKKTI